MRGVRRGDLVKLRIGGGEVEAVVTEVGPDYCEVDTGTGPLLRLTLMHPEDGRQPSDEGEA